MSFAIVAAVVAWYAVTPKLVWIGAGLISAARLLDESVGEPVALERLPGLPQRNASALRGLGRRSTPFCNSNHEGRFSE